MTIHTKKTKRKLFLLLIIYNHNNYSSSNQQSLLATIKNNFSEDTLGSLRESTYFDFDVINNNGFIIGITLMALGLIVKSQIDKGVEALNEEKDKAYIKIKTFIKDKFNKTKDINKKITLAKEFGSEFLELYKDNIGKVFIEITSMCNNYDIDINELKKNINDQITNLVTEINKNNDEIETKLKEKKNISLVELKTKKAQLDKNINILLKKTKKTLEILDKIEGIQKALNMPEEFKEQAKKNENIKEVTK